MQIPLTLQQIQRIQNFIFELQENNEIEDENTKEEAKEIAKDLSITKEVQFFLASHVEELKGTSVWQVRNFGNLQKLWVIYFPKGKRWRITEGDYHFWETESGPLEFDSEEKAIAYWEQHKNSSPNFIKDRKKTWDECLEFEQFMGSMEPYYDSEHFNQRKK